MWILDLLLLFVRMPRAKFLAKRGHSSGTPRMEGQVLVKDTILILCLFILPALYLSGFLFAVRQIVRSAETTGKKIVMTLGLIAILVVLFFATFVVLAFSSDPFRH